jgi:uncharacterized membrane protein YcaP (DUF421 family)
MAGTMPDLTHLDLSLADKAIRTVVVYLAILVLLRLAGRGDLAQLGLGDLVVLLLLSNVVQNAIIGPDDSLLGGLVGATVLMLANGVVGRLAHANRFLRRLVLGVPTPLLVDGRVDKWAMRRAGLTPEDLYLAVREQDGTEIDEVRSITIAPDGHLIVKLRPEFERPTRGDLARVERKLDQLSASLRRALPAPGE